MVDSTIGNWTPSVSLLLHYWLSAGSCIRRDRAEKDGTKKRDQSLMAQEKRLAFMEINKFWQAY